MPTKKSLSDFCLLRLLCVFGFHLSAVLQGIRDGDYSEFEERWENTKQSFFDSTYEALVLALVKKALWKIT